MKKKISAFKIRVILYIQTADLIRRRWAGWTPDFRVSGTWRATPSGTRRRRCSRPFLWRCCRRCSWSSTRSSPSGGYTRAASHFRRHGSPRSVRPAAAAADDRACTRGTVPFCAEHDNSIIIVSSSACMIFIIIILMGFNSLLFLHDCLWNSRCYNAISLLSPPNNYRYVLKSIVVP